MSFLHANRSSHCPILPVLALVILFGHSVVYAEDSASAPKKENPFILVMEGEALGGYSDIEGRDGVVASIDNWLVSPTLKLSDNIHWINLYNGSYNRSAQVVAQEEGGRQTQSTQSHALTTALKWNVNDTWALRPLFFTDWVFVNETEDESFGNGLYDYRDIGGGLESSWVLSNNKESREETRLGFRYLDRTYPNYQSLLSLFNPNGTQEVNEKDLRGYKANLSYDHRSKSGWSRGLEIVSFFKDYTDKRTIDFNGIRSASKTREDFAQYVNGYVSHPLTPGFLFRLDGQFTLNDSNLDFYDTHNTASFADDDFIANYFDTTSFLLRPGLTYAKRLAPGKNLTITVDYAFRALLYPDRKTQNSLGVYRNEKERDLTHTFSGKVSVPLTNQFSWVNFFSYTIADSNQEFESFYLYNYNLWTAATGISFKY